jgi:hypothetical protein
VVVEKSTNKPKETSIAKQQESLISRVYLLAYDVVRSLLPNADRFAIIEETSDKFAFLASNELGDDVASELSTRVLKTVIQNDGSLVMPDALQDQRHGSEDVVKEKTIRSVLCVPFGIPGERRGLIYADSTNQAALFSSKDQAEIEGLAERLTRNLQVISMADPETVQLPSDHVETDDSLRNMLLAVLSVLLLVVGGSIALQSTSLTGPSENPFLAEDAPPDLTERPFGVTRDFLSLLKEEQLTDAQEYLTIFRGRLVSTGELRDLAKELQASEGEHAPFRVLSEEVYERGATVVVGQTLQGAPDNLWTLHFKLEAGDWKLASARGSSFPERVWGKDENES